MSADEIAAIPPLRAYHLFNGKVVYTAGERPKGMHPPAGIPTPARNQYEEGYRAGLAMAIKAGWRIASSEQNDYATGAQRVAEEVERILHLAK